MEWSWPHQIPSRFVSWILLRLFVRWISYCGLFLFSLLYMYCTIVFLEYSSGFSLHIPYYSAALRNYLGNTRVLFYTTHRSRRHNRFMKISGVLRFGQHFLTKEARQIENAHPARSFFGCQFTLASGDRSTIEISFPWRIQNCIDHQ